MISFGVTDSRFNAYPGRDIINSSENVMDRNIPLLDRVGLTLESLPQGEPPPYTPPPQSELPPYTPPPQSELPRYTPNPPRQGELPIHAATSRSQGQPPEYSVLFPENIENRQTFFKRNFSKVLYPLACLIIDVSTVIFIIVSLYLAPLKMLFYAILAPFGGVDKLKSLWKASKPGMNKSEPSQY